MQLWKAVLPLALVGLALPVGAQKHGHTSPKPATTKAPVAAVLPDPPVPTHPEFLRDVAPILDRGGCSGSQCHGKFGGRGGFQISLLTLSPEDDYEPIIYGARGRRINFTDPEKSLLLLKAVGAAPHVGGKRFAVGSYQYNTLLRWIKQGAPFTEKDPRLTTLKVVPDKLPLTKVGQKSQLKVMATYNDGSSRDVTRQTAFQSTNGAVLDVNQNGMVSGLRWGGGAVVVRYLGVVSACFVTLPQTGKGPYPNVSTNNIIDKYVFENLKQLNVVPSNLSDDTEFLRRVTLDTLGHLPAPDEVVAFQADPDPAKRTKMIDNLLERPEYVDYRTLHLADLLRVNPRKFGNGNGALADRSAVLFTDWIRNSVETNQPWDQFVRELIEARGSTYQNGPTNFYRVERGANDRMENIGQAFLGVRMSCARCHKHPFDRWTTDNYWNFASFMGKVNARGGNLNAEEIVGYDPNARVVNQSVNGKNRGKIAPCTYLGDTEPAKETPDMIASLADWMTDSKNPFFARASVNRLWSYYFVRGVIHPVDDMRATTPESVPGLLDALAKELVDHKYDMKYVTRLLLNSRTYQLSAVPNASNEKDDRFFSHYFPKAMPAEALVDAVNQATGAPEAFGSFPERSRAVQAEIPNNSQFLNAFGQSHREFLADIDPKLEPNLVQTLMMINSPYIENKIRKGTTVNNEVARNDSDENLVKALYMRTFCRAPSPTELSKSVTLLKQVPDRHEGAQDLLWALLSAREFFFNH
ncbi:MAG: Translation initiation factor 2 [Chthonomonadales bacterium]|nr:Translation initiation factor 2 [Chthonomonadales bacterium]